MRSWLWVPEILPADFRKFWPVGEGHRECLRREAVRPRASAVWGVADRVDRRRLPGRPTGRNVALLLREPDRLPGGVRQHVRCRRPVGRAAGVRRARPVRRSRTRAFLVVARRRPHRLPADRAGGAVRVPGGARLRPTAAGCSDRARVRPGKLRVAVQQRDNEAGYSGIRRCGRGTARAGLRAARRVDGPGRRRGSRRPACRNRYGRSWARPRTTHCVRRRLGDRHRARCHRRLAALARPQPHAGLPPL